MNLFNLIGKVAFKTAEANIALSETANGVDATSRSMLRMGEAIAAMVAIVAGAAATAGAKILDVTKDVATKMAEIQKESANMQVDTDWYQEWAYIAQIFGTDMGTIGKAVETMTKKVGDGGKATEEALGDLGIGLEEAQEMAPQDLFELMAKRLSEMDDPATKASTASALFGGAWKNMGSVLDTSAEDIAALKQEAHDLGGVMSKEDIEKSKEFQKALVRFHTAVDGVKNSLGAALLPGLTDLVNWVSFTAIPAASNLVKALSFDFTEVDRSREAGYVTDIETAFRERGFWGGVGSYFSTLGRSISDRWDRGIFGSNNGFSWGRKSASGLDYVPFDEYPALLHTGEQVLTAREAEEYRRLKAMPPVNVTQYVTVPGGDPGQIAQATTAALWRWRR